MYVYMENASMSEMVSQFLRENVTVERRKLYIHADDVLAKLDYDGQVHDSEMLLLSDLDWLDTQTLKNAIDGVYLDHLTKVLKQHGIDVYGHIQDIDLYTKMIDTLLQVQYQYDPKSILNRLVLDADKSPMEVYANLVNHITQIPVEQVLEAILEFNDDLMYKLVELLANTNLVDIEDNKTPEFVITRYKNYLQDKRYGIVYNYVINNNQMSLGSYDPKELYLLLEDRFDEVNNQEDLIFELVGLILGSGISNDDVNSTFTYFSQIYADTPLNQMNFQQKMFYTAKLNQLG